MRRRQAYAARTAETAASLVAANEQKEAAMPEKRPENQPILRPPARRAAKTKTTQAPL